MRLDCVWAQNLDIVLYFTFDIFCIDRFERKRIFTWVSCHFCIYITIIICEAKHKFKCG